MVLWNTLCARHMLPDLPLDGNRRTLTNAQFRHNPSENGFDWHVERPAGLNAMRFDGAFRATFSGDQADDCVLIWEFVPLDPGARYRLHQVVRAGDSASAAGFQWRLFYPHNGSAWARLEADLTGGFRAPAEVGRLALMYRRAPGSYRFTGDFSITGLDLEREP